MSETTQGYLGIESESTKVNLGFQSVLNYIREHARSERQKGDYFVYCIENLDHTPN